MKKLLQIIIISALCFIPNLNSRAAEDIAEELLDNKQPDEIVLTLNEEEPQLNSTIYQENDLEQEDNESTDLHNNTIMDNTELDFEIFKGFEREKQISEDSLFDKILKSKITRTDVPSFLLQDDLTFNFEKSPISKIQVYGGFRGSINNLWAQNFTMNYENLTTQVGMYGSFKNPDYKFKLAINPIPTTGIDYASRFISDAYLINTSIPNHQIVAGYSRVQTGVEGGTSSYILPFVARSQIARNFGSARALAIKVIGNYQYVDYNLSVGSSGRYITNGMPGAEFNSWINIKPFGNKSNKYGKLTIGGGFNGGHNRIDYSIASAYVGYNYKKLWANFEAGIANGYNGSRGISENKACGWAATVGWKLNPRLQIIGRIDQFDPNRDIKNDLKREYTIGLNWFIKGQALKIVLNYVFCQNQSSNNSHKIVVATQIMI